MADFHTPFAFLSEVHPQFGTAMSSSSAPLGDAVVEYEDIEVEVDSKGRKRIVNRRKHTGEGNHHLPPSLRLPIEDFPPEPMNIELGIEQGPPVSDRGFYDGVQSNSLFPRDSQHPIMAPATRKSRYYKSHYHEKRPHFRYEEPFQSDMMYSNINDLTTTSIVLRFLGNIALAIALIVCFTMIISNSAPLSSTPYYPSMPTTRF